MKRGDIYWLRDHGGVGSEYEGRRPCVIVSNDRCNKHSPVVQAVMLTTARKKWLPTHVRIISAKKLSTACCETVTAVDKQAFDQYAGHVTSRELRAINRALRIQLDLEDTDDVKTG